ncbi:MAG: hypothetical protein ACTICQ_14150 [Glutamicibacter arilaitensis]|uniref:hypothetical protein n=1 Tax=Glutamicibacter arilaitensis TaxID=256701 RepID=UPI003FBA0963
MSFDPHNLSPEELEELSAQAKVASAAWNFLNPFYAENFEAAWEFLHPVYRLCLVQWWVEANKNSLIVDGYDPEVVVGDLSQPDAMTEPLWVDFSTVILREFRAAYPLNVATAGIGGTPRTVALDTELLYVHPEVPGGVAWQPGEERPFYAILMRLMDGQWRVLNWASEKIPIPGMPPEIF